MIHCSGVPVQVTLTLGFDKKKVQKWGNAATAILWFTVHSYLTFSEKIFVSDSVANWYPAKVWAEIQSL
jgi:hypothetical protein